MTTTRDDDGEVVILPAACLDVPAEIENTMQLLHDEVISRCAQDRVRQRGRVEWRHFHGRDGCRSMLRALYADDERSIVKPALEQFDTFFREHPTDCVLVVASCEVLR